MTYFLFLIQVLCVVINVPGMMEGNVWSTAAFVFCLLIALDTLFSLK